MPHDDEYWLRHTFALADRAVDEGDQAFAAALVGADGTLLLDAANQRARSGRCTAHAETDLVAEASQRWPRDLLAGATLYSSTEPCPMCSGAIAWSGVGRVVYGLSQEAFYRLFPLALPRRFVEPPSCRTILGNVQPPTLVVGPLLEDAASGPHRRAFAAHAGDADWMLAPERGQKPTPGPLPD